MEKNCVGETCSKLKGKFSHKSLDNSNWFVRNLDFIFLVPITYSIIATLLAYVKMTWLPGLFFFPPANKFTLVFFLTLTIIGAIIMFIRGLKYRKLRWLRIVYSALISGWIIFWWIGLASLSNSLGGSW